MSTPLSIRFDDRLLERLRTRSQRFPGSTPSGLAQLLIDEGLRMGEYPGIVFKDGPTGRRAAIALGPDVWEIIKYLKETDQREESAVAAAVEDFALPAARIRLALNYYSAYSEEIETEISEADSTSRAAEVAWRAQQQILA